MPDLGESRKGVTYQEPIRPGVTLRRIDGILYRCTDTGCEDFAEAKASRERGISQQQEGYYKKLDKALMNTAFGLLPWWVPRGDWPELNLKETGEDILRRFYYQSLRCS